VLYPKDYHCSKSLKKFVDKNEFRVSVNRNFKAVIEHCAKSNRQSQGTWITDEIISAYTELHNLKHAHSVEVWEDEELVGGLYGVSVGAIFCGESMFYLRTDASKLAFYWLIRHFSAMGGELVDCQMQTQHLLSMGAVTVPQSVFLQHLEDYSKKTLKDGAWNTCWLTD
jgi:leucyl/phenylalanyl-tRNA--protein transferase